MRLEAQGDVHGVLSGRLAELLPGCVGAWQAGALRVLGLYVEVVLAGVGWVLGRLNELVL